MPLIVSAPGKVILHGEHAVVYGKTALATSLDLRCYLILTETQDRRITLHLPDFIPHSDLRKEWDLADLEAVSVEEARCDPEQHLERLKRLSGVDDDQTSPILFMAKLVFLYLLINIFDEKFKVLSGLTATVVSNLPAGAGLGSSAAYSVCLAAGFLSKRGLLSKPGCAGSGTVLEENTRREVQSKIEAAGVELGIGAETFSWSEQDLELINRWGFEAEKLIHGTPSGIDNSVSTHGGAISFKSGVITHLQRMPRIRILLINTKVPRSTKKMVAGVRERYNRFTLVVSLVLESIDNIAHTAQSLLQELGKHQSHDESSDEVSDDEVEVYSQLGELFELNQHLLNALGVGHPAIDRVCSLAASLGLNAKLTGGGGGGCVIALLPSGVPDSRLLEFKSVFQEAGFECWETNIACCGTTLHSVIT